MAKNPIAARLLEAVNQGNLETVEKICSDHSTSGDFPKNGKGALEAAIKNCHEQKRIAMGTKSLFTAAPKLEEVEAAKKQHATYLRMVKLLIDAGIKPPDTALAPAAGLGDEELALALIEAGVDLNYNPPMGTPLENAIKAGNEVIARALLDKGVNVNRPNQLFGPPLNRAVETGNAELVSLLIQSGADVNAETRFLPSALALAIAKGSHDIVKILIHAGANLEHKASVAVGEPGEPQTETDKGITTVEMPDAPKAHDSTPLIIAVRIGDVEIARSLIKAGANVQATDKDGVSALTWAMRQDHSELVELLKSAGAEESKYAAGSPELEWIEAARLGDLSRLERVRDQMDVNYKHSSDEEMERTALMHAAENGHLEVVRFLLEQGANVDEKCGSGWDEAHHRTALMHAALAGQAEVVQVLIDSGAKIQAKDRSLEGGGGRTPIHYAAEGGDPTTIRLLVQLGAKVDQKSKDGETPLFDAISNEKLDAVKTLLELGSNASFKSSDGITPLYLAADEGYQEMVRLLLDSGADPNPEVEDSFMLPINAASSNGHEEVVEMLLDAGARLEDGEAGGDSPLLDAALNGQVNVVRKLLDSGADPNAAGEESFTPLMAAIRADSLEIVELLVEAGADVNAVNKNGESVMDIARDNINAAVGQAEFLEIMKGDDLDEETKDAIDLLKGSNGKDEITDYLEECGAKTAEELGIKPTEEDEEEDEAEEGKYRVELPDFSEAAQTEKFKAIIRQVTEWTQCEPKPAWNVSHDSMEDGEPDHFAGCVRFVLPSERADSILGEHHRKLREQGAYLFKCYRGYTSQEDHLMLLPTGEWETVIRAIQTNGCNYEIHNTDVIQWLKKLEQDQPFDLTGASHDWCEGNFLEPIKNSRAMAKQMYEFCPDIIDQGVGSVAKLAEHLKKTQKFYFWWD